MATKRKTPKKVYRKAEELREEIIAVSFELFLERGYRNTSISEICLKSGITQGSIYNVFGNKENILKDMMVEFYTNYVENIPHSQLSDDPLVIINIPIATELYAAKHNKCYAEILDSVYSSWDLLEKLTEMITEQKIDQLKTLGVDMSVKTIRSNIIALSGIVKVYLSLIYNGEDCEYNTILKQYLKVFCTLFNVKCENVDETVSKMVTLSEMKEYDVGKYTPVVHMVNTITNSNMMQMSMTSGNNKQ